MEKEVVFEKHADKEFQTFDREVQKEFLEIIKVLEKYGRLELPEAKKIDRNLFEMRVSHQGAYRGFYAYISNQRIVILHFFQKKTQKTPLQNLELAKRRLLTYE